MPPVSPNSKIRVRLVWRLVLCLFGHLTLLLVLAIYLELSLNSVQKYTPVANAEEVQMESLDTVPTLLETMDADRRALQHGGVTSYADSYHSARQQVLDSLASLERPQLAPSPAETERRALVRQWLSAIGDRAGPPGKDAAGLDAQSQALLDRLNAVTSQVRAEVQATLLGLQQQETNEANGRVTLMWTMVGLVTFFTILIQVAISNSIIGPIDKLQAAVRRLQKGDYTARAQIHSGDEIQNLGETFNAMAESMLYSQRQLEQKNGALSLQQEALRHVNASLEERVSQKTQELEEKNQKLSDASRLKDEFLATLSHELRTPLTPIISCAHLLGTDAELGTDQHKNIQTIERNARALSRMIDELLDLSAVMNRKLQLVRERTEMNEWTRATLETMRPAWEKKKLELAFTPAEQPVELEIDPTRLAQVLTNLINNAIKFTDPGGRIEVRLSAHEKQVRIAVTDNGAGLERREIDRIFEMFHQSRTRRTQGVGGLGVGLTVARSLAELHGGGLMAESAGPGHGATFTLWLPPGRPGAADFSSTNLIPAVAAIDRALLRGRRVLLVEDTTDTREAMQRIFDRRGCRVRIASTAEEALALAREEMPEIVVSDIGLPGMSGLELLPQMKALPGGQEIIAIALSGLGREKDIRAASEAGFDAHLLKPVEISVLDQTLVGALQRRAVAAA
jgi:signal transduction histidine kinase/ActR/RegA family two-component response regulator